MTHPTARIDKDDDSSYKNKIGNMSDLLWASSDAFNKIITEGTTNEIDLASHFPFDPERRQLYLNGTRQFPHYNSVPEFTDAVDTYKLQPGDGDKMHIESAQRLTYVVGYVTRTSFAFELNQSLQSGDTLKIGPYNGDNGWYLRHTGSQADDVVDLVRERGGTTKVLEEDVQLTVPVTEWQRIEIDYNWYNVGEIALVQTYINDEGKQVNEEVVRVGEKDRGPETANLKLWMEIDQAAGNTGTELFAGSISALTLGDITALTRSKSENIQISMSGTNDVWEPFYALRLDTSTYPNVDAELSSFNLLQYNNNADIEVMAVSVAPSKTDASGWATPEKHHEYSSAVQETTSVTQVPNTSGTQTDLAADEKPGGHTVATATLLDGGGQTSEATTSTQLLQTKKTLLPGEEVVFCARSSSIGGDLDLSWESTQNW